MINWVSNSHKEPLEISIKWLKDLSVFLPYPSAMLEGIETEALLIWFVRAYNSSDGNALVNW